MVKEIEMDCDLAIEYIMNNVKENDRLELSYNRVFTPGEVLNIDNSTYHGKNGAKVLIHVLEGSSSSTVEVDLEEIKDDLIEVNHIPKNGEEIIILIDKCEVE
ncbi:MAG: DUF2097 domain-containing protein [Methanobrevibacter sp.]|jgi:hypothetical protein|nr:DUF2097 domain-containing protein [Candidatus Methanovirga meridionalis]